MMKKMILLGQFEIVNKQLKQKKKLRIKSGAKIVNSPICLFISTPLEMDQEFHY